MKWFIGLVVILTCGFCAAHPQFPNRDFRQNFPNQGFGGFQNQGFNQGFPNQQNQGFQNQQNLGFPSQQNQLINQGFPSQQNQGFNQGFPSQQNQGFPNQQNQGFNQGFQNQQNQGFRDQQNFGVPNQRNQSFSSQQNQGFNQGFQNQQNQGFRVPTTTKAPSTTPPPEYFRCMDTCPTTSQYNPICGSNLQNYHNDQKLQCANFCGRRTSNNWQDITPLRQGSCTPGGRVAMPVQNV